MPAPAAAATNGVAPAAGALHEWRTCFAEDGTPYFHQPRTGRTTWDWRELGLPAASAKDAAAAAAALPPASPAAKPPPPAVGAPAGAAGPAAAWGDAEWDLVLVLDLPEGDCALESVQEQRAKEAAKKKKKGGCCAAFLESEERERRQLSVGLSLNPDEAGALPAAAFDEDQRVGWLLSVLKERVAGAGLMWKLLKLMPEEDRAREEKGEHEWLSGHCRVLFAIGASRVVEGGRVGLPRLEAEAERLKLRLRLGNDDDDAPSEAIHFRRADRLRFAPFKSGLRQRLLFSVLRADDFEEDDKIPPSERSGAGLDLEQLVASKRVKELIQLHDQDEADALLAKLAGLRSVAGVCAWPTDVARDMNEYFGAEVAFYFCWANVYTRSLWVPAICGVVLHALGDYAPEVLASPDNMYYVDSALVGGFCLLIVLWATLFEETWKRRAKRLLFDWCEDDSGNNVSLNRHFRPDKREPFRPGFYTADGLWVDVDASDKAGATPLAEWSNPRWRLLHQLESIGVFLLFAAACLASIASTMLLKLYLTELLDAGKYLSSIINTVVIMAFNVFWRTTALGLNRRENYRLERDHRRGLVYKLFIFQFINCYFSLFYIAFIKPYGVAGMIIGISDACPIDAADAAALSEWSSADVDGSTLDDGSNSTSVVEVPTCGEELRLLLISLMLTNLLLGPLLELKRPLQMKLLTKVKAKGKRLFAMSKGKRAVQPEEAPPKAPKAGSSDEARARTERSKALRRQKSEAALAGGSLAADAEHEMWCGELIEQFERADSKSIDLGLGATFYEFNELVVQMGYIVMFSVALPSVAAFALANNLLEVRLDAFKALAVVRRPPASAARGIGSWANILHFLSILGIFINLLFLTFTIRPQWSSSLSLNERLLLAVAAEHVLIAAKIALDKLIPDVPAAMRKRTARLQYMATRAAQHGSVSSAASSAALLSRMNGVVAAPIQ